MKATGLDLLRRLGARLRVLRALRHERATAPRTTATYLRPDPSKSDAILAAQLCDVMQRAGIAGPEELTFLADGRYLTNSDLERLVRALEEIDDSVSAAELEDEADE
ncbi:MAG: hypothetical protein WC538_24440 [Thermoanaerobaculia bacterium]|jgi:hypothetical protein